MRKPTCRLRTHIPQSTLVAVRVGQCERRLKALAAITPAVSPALTPRLPAPGMGWSYSVFPPGRAALGAHRPIHIHQERRAWGSCCSILRIGVRAMRSERLWTGAGRTKARLSTTEVLSAGPCANRPLEVNDRSLGSGQCIFRRSPWKRPSDNPAQRNSSLRLSKFYSRRGHAAAGIPRLRATTVELR